MQAVRGELVRVDRRFELREAHLPARIVVGPRERLEHRVHVATARAQIAHHLAALGRIELEAVKLGGGRAGANLDPGVVAQECRAVAQLDERQARVVTRWVELDEGRPE